MQGKKNDVLKLFCFVVVSFGVLLWSACSGSPSEMSSSGNTLPDGTVSIRVASVSRTTMEDIISLGGEVLATGQVYVVPETHGLLTRILVAPGDTVAYNQIVAYVDPSRAGMSYAPSPVRCKAAGTVTAVPASAGNQVSTQTVIAHVGNLRSLEVDVQVPEKYLGLLSEGMQGRVVSRAYPDQPEHAQVTEISPVVDPRTRTVKVTLTPQTTVRLRPGQAVSVDLVLNSRTDSLVVPVAVLTRRRDGSGVFVVQGETVEWRPVSSGVCSGGYVEITGGLSEGDTVVIAGQEELTNGSRVRIIQS